MYQKVSLRTTRPFSALRRQCLMGGLASVALPSGATGQPLPDVPYRLVVGVSAGAGMDAMARLLARHLSNSTGRNFVVENQPGANGVIATKAVARATMPGVRLFMGLTSHLLLNQLLYPKLPIDLRTDLSRLYLLSAGSVYLTINRERLPVNSLQELMAHLRRHPKRLSHGTLGPGSYPHLIGERLNQLTAAGLVHVPYQGEAPTIQALLKGEVDMGWASPLSLLQHPDRLRPLAGNGSERMATMPEVPTFAEAGLPDEAFALRGWVGVATSAQTPRALQAQLAHALAQAVAHPDLARGFEAMRMPLIANSGPEHFEQVYQSEYPKWERLVKQVGIALE